MRFNTLLTVFSAIAMGDGIIGILVPGPFVNLIWQNRIGPGGYLFIQGWGSCLIAISLLAWRTKRLTDSKTRHLFALVFFTYNLVAAALWLFDALSRGWTPLSAASFVGLVLFALCFGYFGFIDGRGKLEHLDSPV